MANTISAEIRTITNISGNVLSLNSAAPNTSFEQFVWFYDTSDLGHKDAIRRVVLVSGNDITLDDVPTSLTTGENIRFSTNIEEMFGLNGDFTITGKTVVADDNIQVQGGTFLSMFGQTLQFVGNKYMNPQTTDAIFQMGYKDQEGRYYGGCAYYEPNPADFRQNVSSGGSSSGYMAKWFDTSIEWGNDNFKYFLDGSDNDSFSQIEGCSFIIDGGFRIGGTLSLLIDNRFRAFVDSNLYPFTTKGVLASVEGNEVVGGREAFYWAQNTSFGGSTTVSGLSAEDVQFDIRTAGGTANQTLTLIDDKLRETLLLDGTSSSPWFINRKVTLSPTVLNLDNSAAVNAKVRNDNTLRPEISDQLVSSDGSIAETLIWRQQRRNNGEDDYLNNELVIYQYGKAPFVTNWSSSAPFETTIFLSDDEATTEIDYTTALAYTTQETSTRAYDHLDAVTYRDLSGETQKPAVRTGNLLDFRNLDVVIQSGIGEAIVTPTQVTLFADTFTGSITTTGNVTLSNGMTAFNGNITAANINIPDGINFDGATLTGAVSLVSGRNLSDVTIVGGLTFNDNTAATFTLSNSTIDVLSNDGTGLLTFNNIGSTVTDFTDPQIDVITAPTPSSITLTAPNGTWAIYDNNNTRVANGTGNTSYNNLGGVDEGVWQIVINREGYNAEIFSWVADNGSANNFTYSESPLLRPEGGNIYTGGATTGVTVLVNGDDLIQTNIPNELTTAQTVVNAQQDFLNTPQGLDWIQRNETTNAPIFGELNGVTYFLNITGFQYDSIPGATPEAAIGGVIVSSATHPNIRTDNGGVSLVTASSASNPPKIILS